MILAGRRLNDSMGLYVADQVLKIMVKKDIKIDGASILILGFTFKENCPDLRNTRSVDLVKEFEKNNCKVDVYDPWVDKNDCLIEYGIKPINKPLKKNYEAIVLAVAHDEFKKLSLTQIKAFGKDNHVIYDIKYLLQAQDVDGRL